MLIVPGGNCNRSNTFLLKKLGIKLGNWHFTRQLGILLGMAFYSAFYSAYAFYSAFYRYRAIGKILFSFLIFWRVEKQKAIKKKRKLIKKLSHIIFYLQVRWIDASTLTKSKRPIHLFRNT